jgi:hypothetical protein
MDGSAKVKDVYNSVILDANFAIESLGYGQYEFGNLLGTGDWDQDDQRAGNRCAAQVRMRGVF